MYDPFELAIIGGVFLLAGTIKGVVGLGLPSVSVALLTATLGLANGLALIVIPTFVTNVWQAAYSENLAAAVRRHWLFLASAVVMVVPGAAVLTYVRLELLSALLGVVLVVYALATLARFRVSVPPDHERWAGTVSGAATGLITGMTGSSIVPGVFYLQALGLPRAELVPVMGMLFGACAFVLALSLGRIGIVTGETLIVSAAALIPALAGMEIGQRLGRMLSEAVFRRGLLCALLALGLYIVARALG
ncbi:MAG: sulfite exporter TauE/SafE family protein [Dichotomicrobium sp.]